MFNFIKKITLVVLFSMVTYAGDPCPISFEFYDAGVPQWLDREDILDKLKADSSKADPLLRELIKYTTSQGCAKTKVKKLSFDLEQKIKEKVFVNQKRFNCAGAHEKLNEIKGFNEYGGKLVLVRGSRRVLLSHVGWNTVCIQSSQYNGKRLSEYKLQNLFDKLFAGYIADRYENP